MQPFVRRALRSVLSAGIPLFAALAHADSLDGTWKASALRVSWSIGDWGNDCGPRPSGGGEAGGTVTLKSEGAGFTLSGLGRNYSSRECWEQMPGLAPRSRSAGTSVVQTTCTMPPGDPRHAKVTTSWYPKGDTIQFDEVGQYQFAVAGSNCTASVRRSRTLSRVSAAPVRATEPPQAAAVSRSTVPAKAEGATATSAKGTAAERTTTKEQLPTVPNHERVAVDDSSTALSGYLRTTLNDPPPPPAASNCGTPGAPVRLEVTPRTKLMRPGEAFQFAAIARDVNGCRVAVPTVWRLSGPSEATLSPVGMLRVPKDAQPAKLEIEASVGAQSIKVGAIVVSEQEFERLLEGGSYGTRGESLDAAEVTLATGHVELETTRTRSTQQAPYLALLALLLVAIAGVTFALVRRLRQQKSTLAPDPTNIPTQVKRDSILTEAKTVPLPTSSHTVSSHPPPAGRLCPVCGKRYDTGTTFCPDDGARLMRAN